MSTFRRKRIRTVWGDLDLRPLRESRDGREYFITDAIATGVLPYEEYDPLPGDFISSISDDRETVYYLSRDAVVINAKTGTEYPLEFRVDKRVVKKWLRSRGECGDVYGISEAELSIVDPYEHLADHRAVRLLDIWGAVLPARIATEDLNDYVEDIHRRIRMRQRASVYVRMVVAIFWTALNAVAYFLKQIRGRK